MSAKLHAEDPEDSSRCTCGYVYPADCRGGIPILGAGRRSTVASLAAEGLPFAQIAKQLGLSVHTVRRVVHR